MNEHYLRNVIEAALLAAGRPVQPAELIQLLDENARPTAEQMRAAIDALAAEYAGRGIELKETAGGLRIQVRRELAGEVSRLWPERPARYSRALLETLALIAYRQPITRGEIEGVRGVAVNPNIIKTLLERNWVRVVGTRDVPGRPELLGTTRDFLDYFGLKSLDELPPLSELKAVGDINLQLDLQGEDGARAAEGEAAASGESEQPAEAGESAGPAQSAAIAEPAELTGSAALADPAATGAAEASTEADAPTASAAEPGEQALLEAQAERDAEDEEEDGDDGEERSAEGGDSRELVAAPRGGGD
jgi:segregation and condensation protein B